MRGLAKTDRRPGAIEIIELDEPEPASNEVLVDVEYAGLCGSDAGIYQFKPAFERMDLPTIIGHEYAGQVVEVGDSVTNFEPGDRIVERPIRVCEECHQCRIEEQNVCRNAELTGIDHHGAYAGYIAVPASVLQPIPDGIDPRHAAMVEPTSIATRAVIENSRVRPGDRVLVAGPGPIGLLTAEVADAQGGDVVVAGVERDTRYRLPLAEQLGYPTVDVENDDLAAVHEAVTDGIGYDVVFDTTGHPSGLELSIDQIRKGGQIVLVGQTGETTMEFTPLLRAEVCLQCSYGAVYGDFERAVRLLDAGDVAVETLLDDRFSLLAAEDAFEAFLAGETVKPVFDVSVLDD